MGNRTLQISIIAFFIVLVALIIKLPNESDNINSQVFALKLLNNKTATVLHELVKTKYFRLIRLNLNSQCPLPYMKKLCRSKSCSVCRCDEKDIPQNWIKTDKVISKDKNKDVWSKQRQQQTGRWVWHVQDLQNDKGQYFDVNTNVQSYSGYNGSYIWSLIYQQNCFKGVNHFDQMCIQQKVMYKIISGLHTSISSHLSRLYKNVTKSAIWADKNDQDNFFFNHHEYNQRVMKHPDRIQNLLFLYQMLIRSVKQIIPYLQENNIITSDNLAQDLKATQLLNQIITLIKNIKFKPLNQTDASFFEPNNLHVKQYQRYIHNISDILNCVQCQKCRLFGKMQTYGLGTALKILLGYSQFSKRNQLVAMFNTLNKISISVNTYFNYKYLLDEGFGGQKYKSLYNQSQKQEEEIQDSFLYIKLWTSCGLTIIAFIWVVTNLKYQDKVSKQFKHAFPPSKVRRQ